MQKSPPEIIQAQLADFSKMVSEIDSLNSRQSQAKSELAQLIESGDITDDKVLDRIGRLQLFTQLFPARLEVRAEPVQAAKEALSETVQTFASTDIRVRFPNFQKLATEKATLQLKKFFSDESALRNAVNDSELLAEVHAFGGAVNNCSSVASRATHAEPSAVIACAKKFVELWKQGEALEAKLQAK